MDAPVGPAVMAVVPAASAVKPVDLAVNDPATLPPADMVLPPVTSGKSIKFINNILTHQKSMKENKKIQIFG